MVSEFCLHDISTIKQPLIKICMLAGFDMYAGYYMDDGITLTIWLLGPVMPYICAYQMDLVL